MIMLRKVKKEYFDDLVSILEAYVSMYYQNVFEVWLKIIAGDESFGIEDEPNYTYDHDTVYGLWWSAGIKMLSDGTPERSSDGKVVIENFKAEGEAMYFLAFCLQEGELKPLDCLQASEVVQIQTGNKYAFDAAAFDFKVSPDEDSVYQDIAEWRDYIKNKYHVFPPKMCKHFLEFINEAFYFTGGLAVEDSADSQCAEQHKSYTDQLHISSLGLSTKAYDALSRVDIETLTDLINCYSRGMLLHIRNFGVGYAAEVEAVMRKHEIPEVHQIKPRDKYSKSRYRYVRPSD